MADTIVINEILTSSVIISAGEQGPAGITDVSPNITLIGDVTGTGTTGTNLTTTLKNTTITAGSYGTTSTVTSFAVDSKGRLTDAYTLIPEFPASVITSGYFDAARFPAFTGAITTAAGSTVTTLANSGVTAGTYTKITVNEKGIITSGSNPATIATFGITDAYTKTEVDTAVASATPSFQTLTGKPFTLAGYGIADAVNAADVGVTIATLTAGKVPTSQLPAYVDSITEYPTRNSFPVTGSSGTIYVAVDTKATYRWSGTTYTNVGSAGGSPSIDFSNVTGKPSTLEGYNILDGVNSALLGADSGVATLGPTGKLTTSQMPAAVDQIQEFGTLTQLPTTAFTNVIYLTLDTNKIYRWSGSAYVEISSAGIADESMKLHTARTIGMTGDVTWTSGIFDGSDNVTGVASLKTSGVSAGSYAKVTVNAKGIVTAGENPTTLSGHGITDAVALTEVGVSVAPLVDGLIPSSNLPSYVDDILEFATITAFPTAGESGKIYIALATNLTYRWTGTNYIQIGSAGSGGVVSVSALTLTSNGTDVTSTVLNSTTTPVITLNLPTANSTSRGALSATDWSIFNGKQAALVSGTTIKTINGASVLGSGDIIVASSYTLPPATPTTLGGVKVDGTTITVDGAGKITAVGGGSGGTGAFASFSMVDGELVVEHSSSFTLSIVDGEFISEYN